MAIATPRPMGLATNAENDIYFKYFIYLRTRSFTIVHIRPVELYQNFGYFNFQVEIPVER